MLSYIVFDRDNGPEAVFDSIEGAIRYMVAQRPHYGRLSCVGIRQNTNDTFIRFDD